MEHSTDNNAGFVLTSILFVLGSLLKAINTIPPIPHNILTYAQFASFAVAIFIGLRTIFKKEK